MENLQSVLLDNEAAARFLGVSETTLPRWRWAGTGPAYLKVGRSVRYRRADLEAYLETRAVLPRNQAFSVREG